MTLTINKKTYEAGELVAYVEALEKEKARLTESNIELHKLVQQREQRGLEVQEDLLKENADLTTKLEELQEQNSHMFNTIALQEQQIEKMKSDVIECFGSEYNVLVAKLLIKWEMKENG